MTNLQNTGMYGFIIWLGLLLLQSSILMAAYLFINWDRQSKKRIAAAIFIIVSQLILGTVFTTIVLFFSE